MISISSTTLKTVLSSNSQVRPLEVVGVSTDTRSIQNGNCFFALVGPNFDGHQFVHKALEQGAACAVVQRTVELPANLAGRVLFVEDTVKALGQLAAWYRRQLSAKVVAITGSAGKTTTRHITHHILSQRFRCHQASKSFNNHIGLPLTILSASPQDEVVILELGTNHPGEIGYLTRIAQPDVAVVTCAAPAHLEGFGSLENIITEKLSIHEGLTDQGLLIVNGDQRDLLCYTMSLNRPYLTFGIGENCDFRANNLLSAGEKGQLTINGRAIDVPLPGRANLMNTLTAWAICQILGVPLSDFAKAIATLEPVTMRMVIETVGPIKIINDCYNANPASMTNALECLACLSKQDHRRPVFAVGCMGELGAASKTLHFELGQKAAATQTKLILAAGAFASDIIAGAVQGGLDAAACKTFADTSLLCDNLHNFIHPADIVLVKGSRSAGMEKAVQCLKSLFPA
jgi:UDP-N-acetylmuramoyl-tripeptide--D-alanyl-D-alanine ligase